jgi:hypothetical protein
MNILCGHGAGAGACSTRQRRDLRLSGTGGDLTAMLSFICADTHVDARFEEMQDGGPQGMERGAVLGPQRLWQPRKGDRGPEQIWNVSAKDGGGDEGLGGHAAGEEGIGQQGKECSRVRGARAP